MDYLIEYTVLTSGDNPDIQHKKMKVKNKSNKMKAQVELEKYLKKKVAGFERLIVHSVKEENPLNDMFGGAFNDIFK